MPKITNEIHKNEIKPYNSIFWKIFEIKNTSIRLKVSILLELYPIIPNLLWQHSMPLFHIRYQGVKFYKVVTDLPFFVSVRQPGILLYSQYNTIKYVIYKPDQTVLPLCKGWGIELFTMEILVTLVVRLHLECRCVQEKNRYHDNISSRSHRQNGPSPGRPITTEW